MGNELAQPVVDKHSDNAKVAGLRCGVSEMQGWREGMEDCFNISTLRGWKDENCEVSLFAIFDGHGGGHVARFAANHIIDSILQSTMMKDGRLDGCLQDGFHHVDRMLASDEFAEELRLWEQMPHKEYHETHPTVSCKTVPEALADSPVPPLPVTVAQLPDGNVVRFAPSICKTNKIAHRCIFDRAAPPGFEDAEDSDSARRARESDGKGWFSGYLSKVKRILHAPSTSFNIDPFAASSGQSATDAEFSVRSPAALTGCTGVVVVMTRTQIIVANAGDSRCVLCRDGLAIELSKDHKPHVPEEKHRILQAGGYVEMGRVNGNLNLTRALGDILYKRDLLRDAEDQIVTACPEVHIIDRSPKDEFLIVGCDGIWEAMSSQQIVDFLKHQIDQRDDLSDSIEFLFDALLSPNPSLVEFGCDNMTSILVDFRTEGPRARRVTTATPTPASVLSPQNSLTALYTKKHPPKRSEQSWDYACLE